MSSIFLPSARLFSLNALPVAHIKHVEWRLDLALLQSGAHLCHGFGYEILTLGCSDNKWKCIPGPFKEPHERPFNLDTFHWSDPVSIHGQVLHWYVSSKDYVISMDVNDETPRKTYLPTLGKKIDRKRYSLLEMGGYLFFVYNVSNIQIDVWILKDFAAQDCSGAMMTNNNA
nr:hypothetical protein CFP56_27018 [Quercus suber]